MLRDITLGQYYNTSSPLHRMDPRTKILWVIYYMVLLFVANSVWEYLIIALFTAAIVKISNVPLSFITRGLRPIAMLMMFTVALNLFMNPMGNTLWQWGFLRITDTGVITAAKMAVRLVMLIIGSSLLTLTTSPIVLTGGIERLLAPFRKFGLPSHEIAMMMSIALRFIPTLMEETDKIIKAQTSRGADFESGGVIRRVRAMVPILVPLFVGAFRRADELAVAMECRCYRGGGGRTSLREFAFEQVDFLALVWAVVLLAAIVAVKVVL
ncbi:MAG: energy-coupling factor transporter transmembrane protein EcfT [Oscillospiraceae bacterium]|nr:energy-coupling factor transporter transmembrane protein EcfT [Oscillospiraceae bacterium]